MRSCLNKVFFWAIFPLVTIQKTVWDCQRVIRTNEFPAPDLNSSVNVVRIGQNVSLFCSNKNTSLLLNYSLFLGTNRLKIDPREVRGKPVIFHQTISSTNDSGPYKCKAQIFSCAKYSRAFNFTIVEEAEDNGAEEDGYPSYQLPLLLSGLLLGLLVISLILFFWIRSKWKARKALRESGAKHLGDKPSENQLYANVCTNQAGEEQLQEIHYATPVFQEVASKDQEACHNNKTGYIYSELNY